MSTDGGQRPIDPAHLKRIARPLTQRLAPETRLLQQISIHHEPHDDQPYTASVTASTRLKSRDESACPKFRIEQEWKEIDLSAHVNDFGLVAIENRAGKNLKLNPTEEEITGIDTHEVLVAYERGKPFTKCSPWGRAIIFEPLQPKIFLYAAQGEVRVFVHIFPR